METWIGKIAMWRRTIFLAMLATVVVTGWQFPSVQVDTDPENMLSADEPVRIAHHKLKKDFKLSDLIVVGIVDETNPKGVWRPEVLQRAEKLSRAILGIDGVIRADVMSLSTSDTIEAGGGMLDIHTIMPKAVTTQEKADSLKSKVLSDPLLAEKLASGDGQGLAIYVPIKDKMISYRVATEIEDLIGNITDGTGTEEYHIAGLPVAEDTFGHDMFLQMAISAPLAGLVLMLMLWWFFRAGLFIAAPMIVAMFSVIVTMGTLIGMGYTVHIMSSMIPIFLMPIAVVDTVHILSEFHDRYQVNPNVRQVLSEVMGHLFKPMAYTTITSMVGFGSLALTPIPPVQVFGIFVALGIFVAWLATMLFVPAFLLSRDEEKLKRMFAGTRQAEESALGRFLPRVGRFSLGNAATIILVTIGLTGLSVWGISKIEINDNPVNWFKAGEKVRVADTVMNRHFAGTYMAFIRFDGGPGSMKEPTVAKWIDGLQKHLESQPTVGKTTSYVDLVKRVNWAMHDENDAYSVVPETREEIAQYLFLFGMSGNPRDLDHFLDYDQKSADVWLQLSSGDNKSMQSVVSTTEAYIATHPMPAGISRTWAGLTYINTVWQEKMVGGMLGSLAGAFIMVALLMLILFRSLVWALLAMLPLSVTIAFSYGFIGLVGKSYDMPVAVLSALALGLSVDFAIHFIERYRETRMRHRTMEDAMDEMFGESARALAKNALIVSIGFTPLLFAPLIPYITVGVLLASIMALSWATTVLLLPALIKAFNVGEKNSDQRRLQMKKVLLALTLTMFAIPASAWAGNATEIMEKAHLASYYAGDDGKARVHMEIINPDGGKRIREFTILRKDVSEGGDQLFFIYFRKPNDVRDMTFLVKKHPKADDDRWLFIPSIRMVKRIAASDARSAFVGSDYTYEDISGRHPSKDNAELLGEEELNGRKVWVVRNTPKKPVRDYAWRKTYVDQATYLVLKESYYDADGKEVRRFTNDEIKQVDGFWIGVAGTMENLELDHKTTVRFSDVKLNVGIPDRVFTERSLKSAPKKWIR